MRAGLERPSSTEVANSGFILCRSEGGWAAERSIFWRVSAPLPVVTGVSEPGRREILSPAGALRDHLLEKFGGELEVGDEGCVFASLVLFMLDAQQKRWIDSHTLPIAPMATMSFGSTTSERSRSVHQRQRLISCVFGRLHRQRLPRGSYLKWRTALVT